MTEAPAELDRAHLVQARHLAELPSSGAVTDEVITSGLAPGIEGLHLDRRVVDLGQRRERQEAVGDDADQQDRRPSAATSPPAAG